MIGVYAVRKLLVADSTLTALVPATRISAGNLPLDTALPAISLTDVSGVDEQFISPDPNRFTSERVQATVMASSWDDAQEIIAAAKSACDAKTTTLTGAENISVRTDGQGPYFSNEQASIHQKSQDFRVTFTQSA